MHRYLRSVGFKNYNKRQLDKLIKNGVEEAVIKDEIIYCREKKKAFVRIKCAENMGISVVLDGSDNDSINVDYCIPYVVPGKMLPTEIIYLEPHSYDESYGLLTDDIKANSTLVCTLENVYECSGEALKNHELIGASLGLTAFCAKGMILLPSNKTEKQRVAAVNRKNEIKEYQRAAKNGDENALEYLALEDIDTYNSITKRIAKEDIYTIVESTFIPCGVECDTYSVVGEIVNVVSMKNTFTGETVYNMEVECTDVYFNVAVNESDLLGEPVIGRRFKGHIWLAARVKENG